jgi:hypothetical protein
MREKMQRDLDNCGRVPYGDWTVDQHEDHLRDMVMFRMMVETIESTEGEWPSIHQARREDEEDRRAALRHPAR